MKTKNTTCTYKEFIRRVERDECFDIKDLVYDKTLDQFFLGDHVVPKELEDLVLQNLHIKEVESIAYGDGDGLPSRWEAKKMAFW